MGGGANFLDSTSDQTARQLCRRGIQFRGMSWMIRDAIAAYSGPASQMTPQACRKVASSPTTTDGKSSA
jgi:hypothetical protein